MFSQAGAVRHDLSTLVRTAWRLDPRRVVGQIVLLLLTGALGSVSLLLLVPIVQSVASGGGAWSVPGLGAIDLSGIPLPVLLGAFVLLMALQALVTRTSAVNAVKLQQEIVDELRQQAFAAILAARWSFVVARRRSDVIDIVTTGAVRCGLAVQQLLSASATAVMAFATAVVALIVAPRLSALAIAGVLVLGAVLATNLRAARRLGALYGRTSRVLQGVMADSMDSLRLVRAHGAAAAWQGQLTEAFADTREVQLANVRRSSTLAAFSTVGLAVSAAILVLAAISVDVPAPTIVVVLLLVARLARSVQSLATSGSLIANSLPAVGDLAALTATARAEREVPAESVGDPVPDESGPAHLSFSGVAFTYPDSDNGVTDIDFDVPRGDLTVLTGPSGAGKSTCADLALGLLQPDRGTITADGRALTARTVEAWRRRVAYVPQETVLFPGSLRANLVWSVGRTVTDDECWEALDRCAASFARSLPDGLDTLVGDRGLRLSGGERQRIAIARALLRRPALLVLDEATSALDDATEAAVLDLVRSLAPAVTVLVIAHRRSTVESAQHVVRLGAGRVVDEPIDLRGVAATPA